MSSKKKKSRYQFIDIEADDSEWSSEYSEDVDGLSETAYHPPQENTEWTQFDSISDDKYADLSKYDDEKDIDNEYDTHIPQASLLPTMASPKLWLLRVKIGKEKQVVLKIMAKNENTDVNIIETANRKIKDKKNNIFSVMSKESLPGYVYVEAYHKQHVIDSIDGIGNIKPNRIDIVPLNEMVDVLTNNDKHIEDITLNSYGRIKKGKYKDDLCQIIGFVSYNICKVKIIPRINNKKILFNEEEYKNEIKRKKDYIIFRKDIYRNGFLEKDILINNIIFDDVNPTVEELEIFLNKKQMGVGEKVIVTKGDYTNVEGKIVAVDNNMVKIEAGNKQFECNINLVEKNYKEGDEVSFKNGRIVNNGTILKVNGKTAIVGYNDFMDEIEVRIDDLSLPTANIILEPSKRQFRRIIKDPLFNRRVEIKHGEYKGMIGTIKDVAPGGCKVQLDSNLQNIFVPAESLDIKQEREKRRLDVSRTPGYKTPGYKTPGYKTPGYKTPGYKTPGYKTPTYAEEPIQETVARSSLFANVLINYNGQQHPLKDMQGNICILKDGTRVTEDQISLVTPSRYDRVCIMRGERKGFAGLLVRMTDDRGDVRSSEEMVKDVPLKDISKMN